MSHVELSILVVSYNTRELTLACLASVYKQTRDTDLEVVVVDNNSSDGSGDAIDQEFPQVRLIRLKRNIGFAAANNLAARDARGDFLLLLNPDTVVLERAIDTMMRFARTHPEVGILGGRTLYGDGTLNPTSCFSQPSLWSTLCFACGASAVLRSSDIFNPEAMPSWLRDTPRQVGMVTGCLLLIGRRLWEQLEGFDERFLMYCEDTDLCLRAQCLGYRCMIYPDATIIHYGGQSDRVAAEKRAKVFRARAQFMRKHWSPTRAWVGQKMLDVGALLRLAGRRLAGSLGLGNQAELDTAVALWQRRKEWNSV